MKYLLVLLVLVVAYNIWRKQRRMDAPPSQRPSSAPRIPQPMVPCAHCGLMLPQSDAITQGGHHYCCADHQRQGPA